MTSPTSNLTRAYKDSSRMCFVWTHKVPGQEWNTFKVELQQSGVSKGSEEIKTTSVSFFQRFYTNSIKVQFQLKELKESILKIFLTRKFYFHVNIV